jgi:Carboxypeptidase regulatory-like domain
MTPTRYRPARLAALAVALPFLYVGPAAAALTQGRDTLPADSSALVGQVAANDTSHAPIRSARVTVVDQGRTAITDSAGHFALTGLSGGVFLIEIGAIGYAKGSWQVTLRPGHVLTHRFDLDPLPFELPEVVVKGRQPQIVRRFADFERRRQAGIGAYITQEEIERANATSLIDVLVTVRGVQQVCLTNDCVAKMVRSPPGCYPQYYVDGQETPPFFARHTPPHDIRGVEIYRGSSETPGEFQGSNSGCGVIAIWTKSSP